MLNIGDKAPDFTLEDKDGNKKYIAEVVAEDFKFVGSRKIEHENNSLDNNFNELANN